MARANDNKCNRVLITVNLAIFLIVLNANIMSGLCSPRVIRQASGTGEAVPTNETITSMEAANTTASETPMSMSATESANSTLSDATQNTNATVTEAPSQTSSPVSQATAGDKATVTESDVQTPGAPAVPATVSTAMAESSTSGPSSSSPATTTMSTSETTTMGKGSAPTVSTNFAYMNLALIILCACNRLF